MAKQHEDKALVEAAQHNTEAFAALYSKYVDKIYNYIYYRVNAHATTAEDLTAEVFMRALRRLPDFEWQGHPYSSYLYQIACSVISEQYKKSRLMEPAFLVFLFLLFITVVLGFFRSFFFLFRCRFFLSWSLFFWLLTNKADSLPWAID